MIETRYFGEGDEYMGIFYRGTLVVLMQGVARSVWGGYTVYETVRRWINRRIR